MIVLYTLAVPRQMMLWTTVPFLMTFTSMTPGPARSGCPALA